MATVNVAVPQVYMPAGTTFQPPVQGYTPSAAILDGAICVLSGGTIATATANVASGIVGVAIQNSVQNYGGSIQTTPALNGIFGYSQVNTPLVPADASLTKVAKVYSPALVEINLNITTGWVTGGAQQANIGSAVGLSIDPSTGFFVADPTQSNKVAEIVEAVDGPSFGAAGDLAKRVRIQFYATVLA
jgi:hypothetical protein